VSRPTKLLVADPAAAAAAAAPGGTDVASPFAYTGAPAWEQAVWAAQYRWLQGLGAARIPARPPTHGSDGSTPSPLPRPQQQQQQQQQQQRLVEARALLEVIDTSECEVRRLGAAYRCGELIAAEGAAEQRRSQRGVLSSVERGAFLSVEQPASVQPVAQAVLESMQAANVPTAVPAAGDGEPRGQHGCREATLRAIHYGLLSAGQAAVPVLLRLIDDADVGDGGPGANMTKRALHALGEAEPAPTPRLIGAIARTIATTRAALHRHLATLSASGSRPTTSAGAPLDMALFDASLELPSPGDQAAGPAEGAPPFDTLQRLRDFGGAGVIQREPTDMFGAELHYLAATAQQCLGGLAEAAV
jgi:hypothetical protein